MSDQNDWNKKVIAEFRANGGKVGGHFEGSDLLLLHTTGAKSGLQRINPLMTMAYGDKHIVIASKGGATSHPDWYFNLVANPKVHVEVGTEEYDAMAVEAEEPVRTEIYSKMAERYPFFSEYAKKAGRVIPVIVLERNA